MFYYITIGLGNSWKPGYSYLKPIPLSFHWKDGVVPPFVGVAVKVTAFPRQKGLVDATMEILTGRIGLTIILTNALVAGFPEVQTPEEVRIQEYLISNQGCITKYCLLLPALTPLTFHWYWGKLPPFNGVAVKVTWVPAQTGFPDGEIVTEPGGLDLQSSKLGSRWPGYFVIQEVIDDKGHMLPYPIRRGIAECDEFVPVFSPLIFHW